MLFQVEFLSISSQKGWSRISVVTMVDWCGSSCWMEADSQIMVLVVWGVIMSVLWSRTKAALSLYLSRDELRAANQTGRRVQTWAVEVSRLHILLHTVKERLASRATFEASLIMRINHRSHKSTRLRFVFMHFYSACLYNHLLRRISNVASPLCCVWLNTRRLSEH